MDFKPFRLPDGKMVSNTFELEQALVCLNPMQLKVCRKVLPWYITVRDCGRNLKIEVFEPAVVFMCEPPTGQEVE